MDGLLKLLPADGYHKQLFSFFQQTTAIFLVIALVLAQWFFLMIEANKKQ
jgi:hypothetical protein